MRIPNRRAGVDLEETLQLRQTITATVAQSNDQRFLEFDDLQTDRHIIVGHNRIKDVEHSLGNLLHFQAGVQSQQSLLQQWLTQKPLEAGWPWFRLTMCRAWSGLRCCPRRQTGATPAHKCFFYPFLARLTTRFSDLQLTTFGP